MTSLHEVQADRKRLGAWYTAENLVRPLIDWAIRTGEERVLDPACGDGAFLIAAARRLHLLDGEQSRGRIVGFDVSQAAVDESARALSVAGSAPEMFRGVCADFFSVQPPTDIESIVDPVDVVVGNPPYIRYQTFRGTSRIQAAARCLAAGVKMGSLASSWAPFVIHASSFLNPGGRLALVLPEELIHSSYAEPVRNFLRASFRTTTIVSFENHVFPGSQERVVLMIADGYLAARCGFLKILRVGSPEALDTLAQSLKAAESFEPDEAPEKWLPGARKEEHTLLRRLEDTGLFVRLSRLGKAGIGYVSGANGFFVLTRDEARAHRLPLHNLTPTLTAARHIEGVVFRLSDMLRLVQSEERVLLLHGNALNSAAARKYIELGVDGRIDLRFKCRVRTPWYSIPGVTIPDAFLTYMSSDQGPRLSLNIARATCSNTLLAVRLPGVPKKLFRTFAWGFYNSATLLSAETVGRPYGGGVLKLEPSEADRLLVPSPSLLRKAAADSSLLKTVDNLVRSGRRKEAESLVDSVLLVEHAGLTRREQGVIRTALASCQQRRRGVRDPRSIAERKNKRPALWGAA